MGAIVDRLTITVAEAKTYLKIDTDVTEEDALVQDLIDGAKEQADEYCNNPFTVDGTEDGTPVSIPSRVKIWCLGMVARGYENRPNGVTQDYDGRESQIDWGDVSYSGIFPYRFEPGF